MSVAITHNNYLTAHTQVWVDRYLCINKKLLLVKGVKQMDNNTKYGDVITRETIGFQDWDNFGNCFANWFQPVGIGQEIDDCYKDGEVTLSRIAQMLHDLKDMTCGQGCKIPLLEKGQTRTFEIERARFWDNEGGTNDVTTLGKITITRGQYDHTTVKIEEINEPRR